MFCNLVKWLFGLTVQNKFSVINRNSRFQFLYNLFCSPGSRTAIISTTCSRLCTSSVASGRIGKWKPTQIWRRSAGNHHGSWLKTWQVTFMSFESEICEFSQFQLVPKWAKQLKHFNWYYISCFFKICFYLQLLSSLGNSIFFTTKKSSKWSKK
jgi:hypothetical protein